MTLAEFWNAAFTYSQLTGASQTSGLRSQKHNQSVGGVPFSAHRFGLAVDVVYDTPLPDAEREQLAKRLGLRIVIEGDHDHLQPSDWIAG